MDNMLHVGIMHSFNSLGRMFLNGETERAINNLIYLSECDEVGLGTSKTRKGRPISRNTAISILELYKDIPKIGQYGLKHLELIQLLVDNISKDRICDFSCSLIKSLLIDYTIDQCKHYKIPMSLTG